MKNINILISASLFSFIITSCGGDEVARKQAKLEKQKQEMAKLKQSIAELEKELALLNTDQLMSGNEVLVASYQVKEQPFIHQVEVRGTVESRKNVTLSAEAMGRVEKLTVTEGQTVNKGELLAELDASVIRNSIAEIETSLELATIIYNRQQDLWNQGIGTEVQFLQTRNNKEALEKRLATLRSQLKQFQIRAPFDGTIDFVGVRVGEMVQPGLPLIRIVNQKEMFIRTDVSESFMGRFKAGDMAEVMIPGQQTTFKTAITSVSRVINNQNRTFSVEIDLPTKQQDVFQPNQVAVLKLTNYANDRALVIPTRLIQTDDNGKFVFVIKQENDKSVAMKARISTGLSSNSLTEVTAGLVANQEIVDEGYREVNDGTEVKLASR